MNESRTYWEAKVGDERERKDNIAHNFAYEKKTKLTATTNITTSDTLFEPPAPYLGLRHGQSNLWACVDSQFCSPPPLFFRRVGRVPFFLTLSSPLSLFFFSSVCKRGSSIKGSMTDLTFLTLTPHLKLYTSLQPNP